MKNPTKDTQHGLEELFSKHQLMPVLRDQFQELGEEAHEENQEINAKLATETLVQMYLHRQADVPTMVGILSPKYGEVQEVADQLLMLCELDYIDFQEADEQNHTSGKFIVKYDVSEDVQEMLAKYQYPLPMVIRPQPVRSNTDTGYLTMKQPIVLNGTGYFKDKDMCLDHINRANSVSLSLSMDTVMSEEGKYIRPTRESGEEFIKFRKRQKQSDAFYANTVDVMERLTSLSDNLYLTHKYDRRGRCYCSGYHVSPQGDDYRKAVLQLSNKEVIR